MSLSVSGFMCARHFSAVTFQKYAYCSFYPARVCVLVGCLASREPFVSRICIVCTVLQNK